MTQLLDQPLAPGSTLYPRTSLTSPNVRSAEDFYLQGSGASARQITIQVAGPDGSLRRAWLASHMEQQVNSLLRLGHGWDGRRARPITSTAIDAAIGLLFVVATELSLPPQVFPLPDGGLQMEWHAGRSVEVEVDAEGDVHVLITDDDGEIVTNGELLPGSDALVDQTREAIADLSIALSRYR